MWTRGTLESTIEGAPVVLNGKPSLHYQRAWNDMRIQSLLGTIIGAYG